MFVSRDEDGNLNKVPVPLHYAYMFVAAAVIGMFTITGLAGSYSRMLIKTARFNQLRQDHNSLQKDYAHLEKAAHEKDYAWLGDAMTKHYHGDDNDLKVLMGGILRAFAGVTVDDVQARW